MCLSVPGRNGYRAVGAETTRPSRDRYGLNSATYRSQTAQGTLGASARVAARQFLSAPADSLTRTQESPRM